MVCNIVKAYAERIGNARPSSCTRRDVIAKILRHCGLWQSSAPGALPADNGGVHDPDGPTDSHSASDEPRELTFVDEATFWATF